MAADGTEPAEADYCRPQAFFAGDAVQFELVVESESAGMGIYNAVWVDPDGRASAVATPVVKKINVTGGCSVAIVTVRIPPIPLCRLEFDFDAAGGRNRFQSGWVTTTADRSRVVKVQYYAYDSPLETVVEEGIVAIDTYFPPKGGQSAAYLPYVYVPGGFFTRGYAPSIDDDSYLTERYVSRYTHAYPRTSRTLVLGDARGIDNALAATLNAAFCLNFEVEGKRYVRYDGAQLEAMGNDALPLRAWSIALQAYDGDTAVLYDPDAWNEGAAGAVIDASGRYVLDASGRYVKL